MVFLSLGLFAATVLLANALLITLAVSTFGGTSTERAYEKGLAYNQVIEAAREQARLGWSGSVAFVPNGLQTGRLELRLHDAGRRPIDSAEVEVRLVRATHAGADFRAFLAARGNGVYAQDLEFPLPGLWHANLVARTGDEVFHLRERLVLR
ncbi:MAG TPA: FixH family protein [Geminicoccaceae bacterium]|nr:FixH family protein [Geminicoccaceae bacterium]